MFDVGLRTDNGNSPFARQLPVFNWYYPFEFETARVPTFMSALEAVDWSLARRRAVYFHIPFCETVCTFCPFTKGSYTAESAVEDYVHALVREVQLKQPYVGKLKLDSIFIGGGTPSILTPSQIVALGECLHTYFDTGNVVEFSVEVEIKSVTRDKLAAFRKVGVNRVSFGVQTFSQLYRHAFNLDAEISQIARVAEWANELFAYTNIDMIYGIGGQQIEDVLADADSAIQLDSTTIDFYTLNNLAAQMKMHRALNAQGFHCATAAQRSEQRRRLAEHMLSRNYARINGYSFSRRRGATDKLIQTSPTFLYHDILYGYHDDALLGYGASALTRVPGYNFSNVYSRQKYGSCILGSDTLPSVAYRVGECAEKGLVTFPYRGALEKSKIPWASLARETLDALDQLVHCGLVSENFDRFVLTEVGWLFYVNLMYFLMPNDSKLWLSGEIERRIAAGRECESVELS
jgi:coproporphyrinogen III oxidase-like Fe-S oxidoreductase